MVTGVSAPHGGRESSARSGPPTPHGHQLGEGLQTKVCTNTCVQAKYSGVVPL